MLNAFKNPQRVALIGAGSEIGQSILNEIDATAITDVLLASRNGQATSTKFSGKAKLIAADFASTTGRSLLVDQLFHAGDLDIAIIAIGILSGDLAEMMNINYVASVDLLTQIAARMSEQKHGKILVISSFAAVRPRLDLFEYGSMKAGLDFYARGLAEKVESSGVTISILRPGFVHTKMTDGLTPAPFSITAVEAGKAGAGALNSKRVVSYAPGVLRYVAIVFRMIPKPIFRKLTSANR
jgi:decaprenylphospho-beta-D-erythro-pentofuranosid-2-ulose 2-reductase